MIVCRDRFISDRAVDSAKSLVPIVQVALHLRLVPIVPLSRHFPTSIHVIYPCLFLMTLLSQHLFGSDRAVDSTLVSSSDSAFV